MLALARWTRLEHRGGATSAAPSTSLLAQADGATEELHNHLEFANSQLVQGDCLVPGNEAPGVLKIEEEIPGHQGAYGSQHDHVTTAKPIRDTLREGGHADRKQRRG